jgi:hypothetical protein
MYAFGPKMAVLFTKLLTELQRYVTSTSMANLLMKSHMSAVALLTPVLLDSLEIIHCQSNKPLFVFPYGEEMNREVLIEVSLKTIRKCRLLGATPCGS